jgi:pimeloyl-ACP methyl ester carboxylesterase
MAWTKVQDLTSARRMTCAYDRAGYGFSDPGPMPRDATAITDDLEAGLKAARIPAPYILVGHSAGGLYVRLFAARHPEQVAAMVLVDPSVVHQTARFDEVFGPGAATIAPLHDRTAACLAAAVAGRLPSLDSTLTRCTPVADPTTPAGREILAEARRPTMLRAELSEIDTIFSTASDEVAAAEPARIVQPVVVLTAGGDYAGSSDRDSAAGQLWARLHDEIAAKSDRGASRMVAHSSHLMMLDRPDVVAQAIEDSIAAAHR